MTRPRLLDLFCGAGGAAMGYSRAGFEVVGVDIQPQPRYPFRFVQGDALKALEQVGRRGSIRVRQADGTFVEVGEFAAVHASPPCQHYTNAQRIQQREHPDLIGPLRLLLHAAALPYVIENVVGAPLLCPITLCGASFGLQTYRHRDFETSWRAVGLAHRPHLVPPAKMGRPVPTGGFIQVVGNFSNVTRARQAMDIPWMTRDELREAIPPAYTEFLGRQLLAHLQREAVA